MKTEVVIPFTCSAIVAAISLLFYGVLANEYATSTLAELVAVTAISAVMQISFVPQAWIYVLSADDCDERRGRLTIAAMLEWCGTIGGLCVVVPMAIWSDLGISLVWAYVAFCLMGSTSMQGYLRGEHCWGAYAACVILPSGIRVLLVGMIPFFDMPLPVSLQEVVILYLLIPEFARYVIFTSIVLVPKWRWTSLCSAKAALGHIYRNWFYDFGSAIVDVGDKYILSLILSPSLLVVYFFARKLSAAATIVLEPFYAYRFKMFFKTKLFELSRINSGLTLLFGYAVAIFMGFGLLLTLPILGQVSIWGIRVIPNLVMDNLMIFASCVFIDTCIAANRWGRYLSLIDGAVIKLLMFRILCFGVFVGIVFAIAPISEVHALIVGFILFSLADLSYALRQIARIKPVDSYAWRQVGRVSLEA